MHVLPGLPQKLDLVERKNQARFSSKEESFASRYEVLSSRTFLYFAWELSAISSHTGASRPSKELDLVERENKVVFF